MKSFFALFFLISFIMPIGAQQNWAPIPCSKMKTGISVDKLLVDSLHNELVLESIDASTICNTTFKGLVAYDGISFHDLDGGLNTHDPDAAGNGALALDCITYSDKTLFGGVFFSVGSNTLYSKGMALWNGAVWDTFPTHAFNTALNWNTGGTFGSFVKWNGKLWMGGGFDTVGNTITTNLVAYDGNTFTAVPALPVSDNSPITDMVVYKNKLIVTGNFYDYPSFNYFRLAQFDGTSWAPVGTGVQGGLSSVWDMVVYKDTLYLAGAFPAIGNAGNYVMKWDGTQLLDAGFSNRFCGYGSIKSLVPFKNRLYAFGNFNCASNETAYGVAYYENGKWTFPKDSIGIYSITSAVVYKDAIYMAGGFLSINGDTTIQKIAKLVCPDFDAKSGCTSALKEISKKLSIRVSPNPSSDKIHIEFEQSSAIDQLTILNTLGQEIYKLAKPALKQEIDISNLPEGIYFLKMDSAQDQGVVKLVKSSR